eukprot:933462-Prymnesium_polylepis.1
MDAAAAGREARAEAWRAAVRRVVERVRAARAAGGGFGAAEPRAFSYAMWDLQPYAAWPAHARLL